LRQTGGSVFYLGGRGCCVSVKRALANGEEEEAGAGLAVPRELQMLEKLPGVQS